MSRVALLRCEDYEPDRVAEAVRRQFELLGGVRSFVRPGDSVLLKPNFIAPRSHHRSAAQTHPAVILEVARLLKDFGARPFVGDSPAWTDAATCARALELTEPLAKLGVPIRQLDSPRRMKLGPGLPVVGLSAVALDADAIINLPKFKAHQQLTATFALKNMYGAVCGKQKAMWHFRRGDTAEQFSEMLIGIYRRLAPAVTIIDGIVAMEGQGPIRGPSRALGWLIGGADPIACELVCCGLIGIEPERLPIVRTAWRIGFGCHSPDHVKLVGDPFPVTPCTDFLMPELGPVKFSFVHICRSVVRQIVLLAREATARRPRPVEEPARE